MACRFSLGCRSSGGLTWRNLLGREPIKLNINTIKKGLADKTILITGAAGSIGSEIARQLTSFQCNSVILIDQAETPLFYLQNELREKFLDVPVPD
ncbi:MAG: polysaccharide biosynthesis protein [Mangrovibacterium sp.]